MRRLVLLVLLAAASAAASVPAQPLRETAAAPAPSALGLVVVRGASGTVPAPDGAVRSADSSRWSALFRATGTEPGPTSGTVRLVGSWVRLPDALPGPATLASPAAVWAARLEAAAADDRPGEVTPSAGGTGARVFQVAGYYLPPGCLSATVCGQPYGYGNPYGGWGYGGNVGVWGR